MRNTSKMRRLVGLAVALLMLGITGLVYAQWLASGSGAVYAKAGKAINLSTKDVSANVSTIGNLLYPGADGNVLVQIHNPNPYPVKVTEISAAGAVTAANGTGPCTTTGVSLNSPLAVSIEVGANTDSGEEVLSGAAHMSNSSDDGCQGATFTIPVTLTGVSGP